MKKRMLLLTLLSLVVLLVSPIGSYGETKTQTCEKICAQGCKDSNDYSGCVRECMYRCTASSRNNTVPETSSKISAVKPAAVAEDGKKAHSCAANNFVTKDTNIVLAANCIEQGLQCTLNGTPCCSPYSCKGTFPNTYCQ